MKKAIMAVSLVILVACVLALPASADKDRNRNRWANDCVKITDLVLTYSAGHYLEGELLRPGFDMFGYNYQAHLFKGSYANAYLGGYGYPPYTGNDEAYLAENPGAENLWCWPYRDTQLVMKWNDAWLSNKDCDGDGRLDRHFGFDSYIGSGAWETNHQWGSYEDDGRTCNWNYFCKIVAVPADAVLDGTTWYTADGVEIGEEIWGAFAIIFEVENDPCAGIRGQQYKSPNGAGFGKYGPQQP